MWRTQAGWRKTLNSLLLVAFGVMWLVVTLPGRRNEVTEGSVHVTHMQPLHGHPSGDKIIVRDRTFEIDYFLLTSGYRQTVQSRVHAFTQGTAVRDRGVIIKRQAADQAPRCAHRPQDRTVKRHQELTPVKTPALQIESGAASE